MNNIKEKVVSGIFWKFAERMTAQLVSMIVAVVLARLLAPSDYGTISLVTIFITIANVFVTDGFGTALIQKKNADNIDFSTVFYFSLLFSIGLYFVFFCLAEVVATFYNLPILRPVLRVLALKIPIAGMNSVQHAYVSRHMMFKRFFRATILGTFISAVVGISMAYTGFGVWALVAQELTTCIINTSVLWITVKWRPNLAFSLNKLWELFSYGWKLLVQSFLVTLYGNLRSLIIGKVYSTQDLAYYTKGSYYPNLIITNVDTALSSTLFPAMSKEQQNIECVKSIARRTTQLCSYVLSPLLIGFAAVADKFVLVLLTEKWLPIVPYIRIICVALLFRAAQTSTLQAIKSVGRSDVVLKIDIPVRILGVVCIIVAVKQGILYIAISEIMVALFGMFIYAVACEKIVGYCLKEVIQDFLGNVFIASIMGLIISGIGLYINLSNVLLLVLQFFLGVIIYLILSLITKNKNLNYLLNEMKSLLRNIKRKQDRAEI